MHHLRGDSLPLPRFKSEARNAHGGRGRGRGGSYGRRVGRGNKSSSNSPAVIDSAVLSVSAATMSPLATPVVPGSSNGPSPGHGADTLRGVEQHLKQMLRLTPPALPVPSSGTTVETTTVEPAVPENRNAQEVPEGGAEEEISALWRELGR